ncbi:uncharacterized protein BXZ73DRAFT_98827 [Epithele typhae]|uniref:uncharacterized protein n=1 Tax=Epithele typhae TaxID=378194 RepID=UPI002007F940|nr:uncharacterized protein BXZ73DRAFT_98827 [Epithele typhae]KAH9940392.1 hypothetical protein BXZ73DRAFT_98827 [Epithele typhae]
MQLFVAVSFAFALVRVARGAAPIWAQCGGIGWIGETACTVINPYYSQCLSGAASSSTAASPPSSTVSSSTASTPVSTEAPRACATPSSISGYNNAKLPNPFFFNDGTAVQSAEDWKCRSAQITALVQGYEGGAVMPAPTSLTATFTKSGTTGTLAITAKNGANSITFSPTIKFPSGTAPAAGWPLIIGYGGGSIPIPSNVAVMTYSNSDMAQQNDATSSRGVGLFYNLFGKNATASAMTAWAWGVSRIIDALEATPAAQINTARIGVTGCSRNGKGALVAGALEPRIRLTIPQESGSGGDACWRLSLFEQNSGSVVQTATEIVTENVWFSTNFNNYVNSLDSLPYDHHLLAAMVAPRPMISFENTDYVWLSPLSSYGCMSAAHTVWSALGVPDLHGFEQVGGHAHCAWPSSLSPQLNAFISRFLLDQSANTTGMFASNMLFGNATWTPSQWMDWTTPTLSALGHGPWRPRPSIHE